VRENQRFTKHKKCALFMLMKDTDGEARPHKRGVTFSDDSLSRLATIKKASKLSVPAIIELLLENADAYIQANDGKFPTPFVLIPEAEYTGLQRLKENINHPELLMMIDPEKARQMEDARSRDPKLDEKTA
jgi:hypothetical protein